MNDATTGPSSSHSAGHRTRVLAVANIALAVVMQLAVLVPFTVASGLVAPMWAVVALYVLWLAAAVALVAVARRRPMAAPLVPLTNAALLWGVITFGDVVLGWTA